MNTKTKFNHRDISTEDGVLPVDLYAAVAEPVSAILTFAQLLDDNLPDLTNDSINETLLRQLKLNAMDVLSIAESFVNSFDFVGVVDEIQSGVDDQPTVTVNLTKGEWNNIQTVWEKDHRTGFDWLINELRLSVSRQAISVRAKRKGWTKKVAEPKVAQN